MFYVIPISYVIHRAHIQILLHKVPLSPLSLLRKLRRGGLEQIKATEALLDQSKIEMDIVLLIDKIYLQKCVQYQGSKLVGVDGEGNFFKGVITYFINSLKDSTPFVVKVPEVKIEGAWLSQQIDECIKFIAYFNCGSTCIV